MFRIGSGGGRTGGTGGSGDISWDIPHNETRIEGRDQPRSHSAGREFSLAFFHRTYFASARNELRIAGLVMPCGQTR